MSAAYASLNTDPVFKTVVEHTLGIIRSDRFNAVGQTLTTSDTGMVRMGASVALVVLSLLAEERAEQEEEVDTNGG